MEEWKQAKEYPPVRPYKGLGLKFLVSLGS